MVSVTVDRMAAIMAITEKGTMGMVLVMVAQMAMGITGMDMATERR
jgi:hypothetical protein